MKKTNHRLNCVNRRAFGLVVALAACSGSGGRLAFGATSLFSQQDILAQAIVGISSLILKDDNVRLEDRGAVAKAFANFLFSLWYYERASGKSEPLIKYERSFRLLYKLYAEKLIPENDPLGIRPVYKNGVLPKNTILVAYAELKQSDFESEKSYGTLVKLFNDHLGQIKPARQP
jgi:hypothetical protein